MTVLKLDISFLAGFVAPALFGFVETPLFDFSSRFALLLLRFFSVLIIWTFLFLAFYLVFLLRHKENLIDLLSMKG